ncbi:Transcription factor Adf-1 [Pseudolycoriella hygida]|uniref:Transcription factor Adf-1 n=1 Tax=Pseudolycoriella hygida TaxID=35572 RepID=A0A9Q0S930_9DIPT|nr:Transcription factor Adf-1 [Pseudolycoriella hygida]
MNYNDVKLIDLVKHCPTVYDSKIAEFKIPHRKEEAWELISKEMEITVLECRNRWRTLRERYARELRRHDINSSWPYFQMMEFLTPFIKPREIRIKLSNSTVKTEIDEKSRYDESLLSEAAANSKSLSDDCAASTNNFVEIEEVYYDDSNYADRNEDCPRMKLKRKSSVEDSQHEDTSNMTYQTSQSMEDKLFCSSVACTLNKLSRVHNIKAKCEIYKVLEKYIELEER